MSWSEAQLKKLYAEEKRSAKEIARMSNCSEHKVNYWLEKHLILKRSISEAIYVKHNPRGDPFKIREVETLADAKLFGLGLGIYWGEGNKKNKNSVRVGNTDPRLVQNFIKFLIRIFDIDTPKLRFGLQIFSDVPRKKALQFWLDMLREFNIKKDQFFKSTVTPRRGVGNYREKSKHGVLTVHFSNSKLKRILDSMLPE